MFSGLALIAKGPLWATFNGMAYRETAGLACIAGFCSLFKGAASAIGCAWVDCVRVDCVALGEGPRDGTHGC